MRAQAEGAAIDEQAPARGAWAQAIALLGEDLHRRDAAPRTRRAYSVDAGQFARWAIAGGKAPRDVSPKDVRRYIASLSETSRGGGPAAPSTSAR